MIKRIVIYGAGKRCIKLCKFLEDTEIEVITILDSDSNKWNTLLGGCLIQPPERILSIDNDIRLVIAIGSDTMQEQARKNLRMKYQYSLPKEISYEELILEAYKQNKNIKRIIQSSVIKQSKEYSYIFSTPAGLGLGGVEEWVKDICSALLSRGYKKIYIISKQGNYNIPVILNEHIIYQNINFWDYTHKTSMYSLVEMIMEQLPCKIVVNQADAILIAASLIKHFYPELIEIVSVIHVGLEEIYKQNLCYKNNVDLFIGVSQDIRNDMIRLGIQSDRIYAMRCPFICEKEIYHSYTLDSDKPIRIGYAGRMDGFENSQKRMDLVLKLIKLLDKKGVNFQMELAGEGSAREEMQEYIRYNVLEDKVKFLGRLERTEIPAFWKKQDICINLADFEGRSISIIEAMGNGAVPIVTQVSGTKEDITDGINGFLIPLQDYYTMAERIQYLAENRGRLLKMGQLAHDAVYSKSLMSEHLRFWEENIL